MSFTANDVKALRERTSCGMMDCKNALTEANGDMEKAVEILREKGLAKTAKKAGRIAAEGLVHAVSNNGLSCIVEVNIETDFAARTDKFVEFVNKVAATIMEAKPADVDALMTVNVAGTDIKVEDFVKENIATIGENIKIRRFELVEGDTVAYIHGGGRIGALVSYDTDIADKAAVEAIIKNVAMQVAAMNPQYLNKESVPAEIIEKEKEILTAQAINEGKPANIAEKMVMGRIGKYYKEVCLVEQDFFIDPDFTVAKYVDNEAKNLGGAINVKGFIRYERGDGIEKKQDNFADEVASMTK